MTSAGVEIREIHAEHLGEVLWEDSDQVLACSPSKGQPRAF